MLGRRSAETLSPRGSGGRPASILSIAFIAIFALVALTQTAPFRLIELRVFDYLSTTWPPPRPLDGPIVVAIDEPSFAEIGMQWPWPRDLHARLVEALRAAGAKAIGLDIIFAEPSKPAADAALATAVGPDVVLAGDLTLIRTPHADQMVRVEPLADLTTTGAWPGLASISLDRDGTLRRIPAYPDGFARTLLDISGRDKETADPPAGVLLQTFGPGRTYQTASYYQALDPMAFLPEGFFEGRTVIVGLSTQSATSTQTGGADDYATSWSVRTGTLVSGPEIQATIFDNLAHDLFITPAPYAATVAALLFGALAAGIAAWRQTGWRTVVVALGFGALCLAGSFVLLRFGRLYLPPIAPALSFVAVAAAQGARDYAAERRLRHGIMRAFSQYLSPVMVERLASDPSLLHLGGEKRVLTVLFSDVRGFTTIAETMKEDPQGLTVLINRLLNPLTNAILDSGGTIDKYIGDCVMAFWNAPLDDPDHATHAVDAAFAMLAALDRLNEELRVEAVAAGRPPLGLGIGIGIGINTGECVVGNMGSDVRFDYTALGDSVNLAARLESQTRVLDVDLLVGPETARLIRPRYQPVELGSITVKGKTEPVVVSTVERAR